LYWQIILLESHSLFGQNKPCNFTVSGKGWLLNISAMKEGASVCVRGVPLEEVTETESLALIMSSLEDAKAEDIVVIDLRGRSVLGDFVVIASGRSPRHVLAVADQLLYKLREGGVRNVRIEGLEGGDWVLLDTGDTIIHLFRPEIREFYNLEKMWQPEKLAAPERSKA